MSDYAAVAGNMLLFFVAWLMAHSGLPPHPIKVLTLLCAVDLFMGVAKAHALRIDITSRRFTSGLLGKCGAIIFPICVGLGLGAVGFVDASFFSLFVVSGIILSEVYSIGANLYSVRTKKHAKEWDAFSFMLKRFRDLAEKILGG